MKNSCLSSRAWIATLLLAAVFLVLTFREAPALLLSAPFGSLTQPDELATRVGEELTVFWRADRAALGPALERLVEFWFWWHLTKVVICTCGVVVLGLLVRAFWQRFDHAGRAGAVGLGLGAILTSTVLLGVLVLLLANVQSMATPLISVLQVIPADPADATTAATVGAIRQGVSEDGGAYPTTSLRYLTDSVTRYHAVLVAVSLSVAAGAVVLAVASGIRRARTARDLRRIRIRLLATVLFAAFVAITAAVIALDGLLEATDPAAVLRII